MSTAQNVAISQKQLWNCDIGTFHLPSLFYGDTLGHVTAEFLPGVKKKHGGHSFYFRWKLLYFKIVCGFSFVLITFLVTNVHFVFIVSIRFMYTIRSFFRLDVHFFRSLSEIVRKLRFVLLLRWLLRTLSTTNRK